jgi:hypothetical protein
MTNHHDNRHKRNHLISSMMQKICLFDVTPLRGQLGGVYEGTPKNHKRRKGSR